MYEVMVLNPRGLRRNKKGRFLKRARSRRKARATGHPKRRRSTGMPARNAKGRFVKRHKARRRRRSHARRRSRNPRRSGRRAAVGYVVGTKKIRRRKLNSRRRRSHSRRRHRNPINLRGITGQLMPAALGAVGGVALDVTMGYVIPQSWFPVSMATGYGLHATRVGAALGLGWVARRFLGSRGAAVANGALVVALYGLAKYVTVQFAPTLPGLSGSHDEVTIDTGNLIAGGGAGAYMRGLGYLPSGERGRGVGGRVGAYLVGVDTPLQTPDY